MAHADYDCCMICDRKMSYSAWEADTKKTACVDCLKAMRSLLGQVYLDDIEFMDYLSSIPQEQASKVLTDLRYCKCYYDNRLDEFVVTAGLRKEDTE